MSEERLPIPKETRAAQGTASDPGISAWVSANAGSGKTFVLTRRVIRLLLSGVQPGRILCLTFTKAAAAEMSNRVFKALGEWATMPPDRLRSALHDMLGRDPTAREMERAPTLFASSLDTPGGLKIQTIHAFCEALLHQFPLEANISGHFKVIEAGQAEELLAEARRSVITMIETGTGASPERIEALRPAFSRLIELASDSAIEAGLKEIIARREAFMAWTAGDPLGAMEPLWREGGMRPGEDEDAVIARGLARSAFDAGELATLARIARTEGGRQNDGFAASAEQLLEAGGILERFRARNKLWLTDKGEPRKSPLTKGAATAAGGLAERLEFETAIVFEENQRAQAWRVLAASEAMFVFADAILERYLALKRRRGLADFDDLIAAARNLLYRSDVRAWVQYKLDRGIEHVLIDEAQDTSPRQWDIVNAIVEDFHAGEGASNRTRTVFAVGDEKQSIYSFQGADPRKFSQEARALGRRARQAGQRFEAVALNLSFRSAPDVLDAVDAVFAIPENFQGLSATETRTVHAAIRRSDPGEVWLWPLDAKAGEEERTEWLDPLDKRGEEHPAEVLAGRIAATVRGWIDRSEKLPGRDRPIRCGDILILVRRRDAFSTAVIRRLKENGLSIAGADRLRLTQHIAIEDLLALGRVMLMPDDDLALAGVLKSPLFGVDDEQLIALAARREGEPLLDHLALLAEDPGFPLASLAGGIVERIARMRAIASNRPPYEFYAHVLGREGGRRAFLSRLGTEAADVLDAFEQAAIGHEQAGLGALEDFIAALTRSSPEIKREIDMKEDEIRVITVHSAKGLEAPIVFLVDPCSPGFIGQHRPALVEVDSQEGAAFLWASGKRASVPAIAARDEAIAQEAEEEYRRLLYVGMTRAADRLVVCGWRGVKEKKHVHWHKMIEGALGEQAEIRTDAGGFEWRLWQSRRPETAGARRVRPAKPAATEEGAAQVAAPAWLSTPAIAEPPLPRPLTPSGAAVLLGEGGSREEPPLPGAEERRRFALERGSLTHKLLEFLPDIAPERRSDFIGRMIVARTAGWPEGEVEAVRREVDSLMAAPELAALFGPHGKSEASIAGQVRLGKRDVTVAGQIDRLAVTADTVWIADYKTNFTIPAAAGDAPPAYVLQLALYRALLGQIYPGHAVRCMLIWTRNATAMEIPSALMDAVLCEAAAST